MRRALRLHPDSRCAAVLRIEVNVARPRPGDLVLCYAVTAKMSELRMPAAMAPARADELWRHTCFEAFVRASPSAAYYEFNFAPSTQWALYRFDGYRSGMSVASEMSAPRIEAQSSAGCYNLQASLDLQHLPELRSDATWTVGLSAVIEETSGDISYWALAHARGKADFHHSDCFAIELPPAW